MKSFKNSTVWMAVLTFSAVMLGAILISAQARNAQAAMLLDQTGFSMMTSGNGGDETLVVIDKSTQKMIAYHLNANGSFDVVGAINFR